tara:strand:+ start:205 stop:750 length:546 start_codon:yes stop_codon:yes gene_type:complete
MEALVKKDMLIGDVIQKYPSAVDVLMAAGVHCVGCQGASHESIEQGFKSHGMSDAEIEEVITDLNKMAAVDAENEGKAITVTEKAATKLKEILKAEGKPEAGLRVDVAQGGCKGNTYALELTEDAGDALVLEEHGVKIFINKQDQDLIKGSTIDYRDDLQDAGFRITNPNNQGCGCGKSFS